MLQLAFWRGCFFYSSGLSDTLYVSSLCSVQGCVSERCGRAGEPAVHLLERLLAFDPGRRCSGEEALAHEYFADLEASDEDIGMPSNFAGQLGTLGLQFMHRQPNPKISYCWSPHVALAHQYARTWSPAARKP